MYEIFEEDRVILKGADCFDIEQILTCGQCFRFGQTEDGYFIIAHGKKIYIHSGDGVSLSSVSRDEYNSVWKHYFDLETDYRHIQDVLTANDSVMRDAVGFASGIRLLNQDPWECLISFIISQNNNIPRIKSIIEKMSRKFGTEIDDSVYAFPSPDALSSADIPTLMDCGTGFRAKYIVDAVKRVCDGSLNLTEIAALPSDRLQQKLMEVYGIGKKVADCVMLFSFGRREMFPVDVWVKRVMERFYFNAQNTEIPDIHKLAASRFGEYGGYAQQYLFHYARCHQ